MNFENDTFETMENACRYSQYANNTNGLARVRKLIAIPKFHQNLIRTCSRITLNTWCNNTVGNRAKIRTFAHISSKLIGKNREW